MLGASQPLHSHWHKHYFPERGQLTPMPPTDPTLYRLYEIIAVYGYAIKSCVHEKCMSASACFPRYLPIPFPSMLSSMLALLLCVLTQSHTCSWRRHVRLAVMLPDDTAQCPCTLLFHCGSDAKLTLCPLHSMSAINFSATVDKVQKNGADNVEIKLTGASSLLSQASLNLLHLFRPPDPLTDSRGRLQASGSRTTSTRKDASRRRIELYSPARALQHSSVQRVSVSRAP